MGTGLQSLLVAAAWMHHASAHSSYVFAHWKLFIGALVPGPWDGEPGTVSPRQLCPRLITSRADMCAVNGGKGTEKKAPVGPGSGLLATS